MITDKPENEFRRGWPIVLSAGIGIGCGLSPIPFNTIGHLVIPLQNEFGWNRGEIYFAVTLLGMVVMALSPFFGRLVDRIGVRKVALGSTLGFGLGWAGLVLTPSSLPGFYAIWILISIIGGASIPVSWTRAIAGSFHRQRGLALALALASTGATAAIINIVAPMLIEWGGWRAAVLGTAAMPLFISLPVAYFLFKPLPENPAPAVGEANAANDLAEHGPPGVSVREALTDKRFWLMFAGLALVALAFGGIYANFVPLLMGGGFTAAQAGAYAGTLGLAIVAGRVVAGYLIDRYWAPAVAFPLLAAPALGCLLLASGGVTPAEAMLAALLLGFASGAETDLIAFLAARYFGLKNYGQIYGSLYIAFGLSSAVAPALVGRSFDVTGSYQLALWIAAVFFVVGAALLLLIGPYPEDKARTAKAA